MKSCFVKLLILSIAYSPMSLGQTKVIFDTDLGGGQAIKTGEVFNEIDRNTPLYVGSLHFSNHAPWMKAQRTGSIIDNSTFDQTAVLYAVRGGVGKFWERVEGGRCVPDEKGGNSWVKKKRSKHSYLKLIKDAEEMAVLMETLMLGDF